MYTTLLLLRLDSLHLPVCYVSLASTFHVASICICRLGPKRQPWHLWQARFNAPSGLVITMDPRRAGPSRGTIRSDGPSGIIRGDRCELAKAWSAVSCLRAAQFGQSTQHDQWVGFSRISGAFVMQDQYLFNKWEMNDRTWCMDFLPPRGGCNAALHAFNFQVVDCWLKCKLRMNIHCWMLRLLRSML